jgi:hypothetical protein
MKRTLLDITNTLSRTPQKITLEPYNLYDSNYYIFLARNYRYAEFLPEFNFSNTKDRLHVNINSQYISTKDFETEISNDGLLFKFIKNNFAYSLDENDYIEVIGSLENYA